MQAGPSIIDMILFAAKPPLVDRALDSGITSFIVDWECRGKEERQCGADTQIALDTPEDLAGLPRRPGIRRFCRINRFGPWTEDEVEAAVEAGATHLFLPMCQTPEEIHRYLSLVGGRCSAGVLIETAEAVDRVQELARFPVAFVYVGLIDLAISRNDRNIFRALVDGTVDRVREAFASAPFGFGGLTVIDGGRPLPCELLLGEMARLGCSFTFLRRSFHRDIPGRDMRREVLRIQSRWTELRLRPRERIRKDRQELALAVEGCSDLI